MSDRSHRAVLLVAYAAAAALVVVAGLAYFRGGQLFEPPLPEPAETSSLTNPYLRPVVLIPGWGDVGSRMAPLSQRLQAEGWAPESVFVLNFVNPIGSNVDHADELEVAVDSLLARNPWATEVDIVAHSMGGLASRWYIQHAGQGLVRRLVTLGSPHRGTVASLIAPGPGGEEMKPGSPFLAQLDSVLPEGVEGITIRSEIETHIIPNESATLPGVPDTVLCCNMHWTLPTDGSVMEIILDFLSAGPSS